ncbi:hypothetical protein [Ferruginibacter sp.]|nr:hypothetical protein [Ferruginibacter sp.]
MLKFQPVGLPLTTFTIALFYETKAENTYAIYPEAFSMFDPYTDMI